MDNSKNQLVNNNNEEQSTGSKKPGRVNKKNLKAAIKLVKAESNVMLFKSITDQLTDRTTNESIITSKNLNVQSS